METTTTTTNANNLYQNNKGIQTFGGVISTDKKETLVMFDSWEHEEINNSVPVGIDMLLFRVMEEFLDLPTVHVKGKRLV